METKTQAETTIGDVVLRAVDVTKTFGATQALKGVNLEARAGKVTVLFGENGAGKSTLMKILAGVQKPTSGHLEVFGEQLELSSTTEAVEKGISIIHQELNLCPNLSVRDNIFLGREQTTGLGTVNYRAQSKVVADVMKYLEENISPDTLISDLRIGQQQIVEIARALSTNARILIMDEPTSALSAHEVEVLFKVIRELTSNGVAIIYISHHLEEAIEISDYAVVFRNGELVATEDSKNIDLPWVVRQMVGQDADYDFRDAERNYGDVLLDVRNAQVVDENGRERLAVNDISLTVKAGEVVCLFGLMGAGRTELVEAIAGRTRFAGGSVHLGDLSLNKLSIEERIEAGLVLVPEDRQRDGLVQSMSVGQNITLSSMLNLAKRLIVGRGAEKSAIKQSIQDVRVKTQTPEHPIGSLSGGNQQKVVIAKTLLTKPKVLVLDEPTRGIDVGAKGEIFSLLFEQAKEGLGVLYVTSEISEAITASHRIVVLAKGRIVKEFDPRTCTREDVMAATGGA
ncbi:sugar ABC transporter ATP-binding protein [Micrococcales bacterium 31B]|nr:sugar ABC transporter ATP-binding protein [Micrococcales bacterium 31B]